MKSNKTKIRIKNKTGWLFVALILCGCQQISEKKSVYLANHANDYLNSTLVPPLEVPEGLSLEHNAELYPLPHDIPAPGTVRPVALIPPGFGEMIQ